MLNGNSIYNVKISLTINTSLKNVNHETYKNNIFKLTTYYINSFNSNIYIYYNYLFIYI